MPFLLTGELLAPVGPPLPYQVLRAHDTVAVHGALVSHHVFRSLPAPVLQASETDDTAVDTRTYS